MLENDFGVGGRDVVVPLVGGAVHKGGVIGQTVVIVYDEAEIGHGFAAFVGHGQGKARLVVSGIDVGDPTERGGKVVSRSKGERLRSRRGDGGVIEQGVSLRGKVVCPAHILVLGFGHDKHLGDIAGIGDGVKLL